MLEGCGAVRGSCHQWAASPGETDPGRHRLLLMDLQMPGMDGYDTTDRLRKRGETLPIIALTASSLEEVAANALAAGLNDVIIKPFNPQTFTGSS